MSNEPNKPIMAQELTDKELEGIVGGRDNMGGLGIKKRRKLLRLKLMVRRNDRVADHV